MEVSPADRLKPLGKRGGARDFVKERLIAFIDREAVRAKARIDAIERDSPRSSRREISQRLIDSRKATASAVGGVTGIFGFVTIPLDLAGMAYLELALLVDIAVAYGVVLKNRSAKDELLHLFSDTNGFGAASRASPRVAGSVAKALLARGGLKRISTAMPLIAAPISAYLNNHHVQKIGDAAVRHYGARGPAHEKSERLGTA